MPTIDISGAPISYTDTGLPVDRPDASTIVFGHGLLFGGWVFQPQITALSQQYRCVTLDWRGQGDTPATTSGYDMDTLTSDAISLIRELGLAQVHWVGLSMGGFVGLRIASRHGELLRSLSLLDSSADGEEPAKVGEYKRLAWIQRLVGIRPLLGSIKPHMFGPTFLADPASKPVIAEWTARLRGSERAAAQKAVLGVADRPPVYPEIDAIAAPTLIVVGADDTSTPPIRAQRMADRIPGSQLHIVPSCGHTSTLEQPAAITGLLADFLAEVEKS
jgi:3-oxoadipate enol-lactonase